MSNTASSTGDLKKKTVIEEEAVGRMESEGGGVHKRPPESSTENRRPPVSISPAVGPQAPHPLLVGEIMTKEVRSVSPRTTLTVIAALMKTEGVGVVPVVDPENRVVGVVTDRDIVIRGIDDQNAFFTTEVRQIMTKAPATVLAGETIVNALALMGGLGVKRLPVVNEENVLIGILALADVVTRTDYSQEVNDTVERIAGNRPA